ncbi:PaaI family thioesterase [Megasphaera elsdenii]|uniref:Thioesterase family protein n=2 Tax=Megasphaera elsdenii TaxID=907 RepID=G0VLH5_MEGEL|nr:hotdog fold domain-containing protein [Megasphaera elsdenii]AVO26825.1 thioesterase [Megasphaera elsdenii]AVO74008.1 thioesterase [Megasphaera elsdenii DSM 20460]MCI7668508.1 hotdog fold thioesterase [Megasphaera elsdenii]MDY5383072.1 hotdog fold domain-containing protein [Megasphaera elsdenii]CCC72555.1 thioesterase family protein [Megasphaera elsdenii DSM 20460]
METAYETNHCFGCGRDNPIGLKLDMKLDGNRCVAYFTPKVEHESYGDRMHGGLTSTLLDEVMGDYVFRKAGKPAYTARLEIRFRSAIRIGETVKVEGWPEVHRGRLFIMKGKITHADGTPAAEAKAEMMLAK